MTMTSYETQLGTQQFDDFLLDCNTFEEMVGYSELWSSVEEVTPELYDITLSRVSATTEDMDINVPLPLYEMYKGDTKDDAITLTVEALGGIMMSILSKILDFIKWIGSIIFKTNTSYKKKKRTVDDINKSMSSTHEAMINTIENIDFSKVGLTFSTDKIFINNKTGDTKDVSEIYKIVNNMLAASISFMPDHFSFKPTSGNLTGFVSDYITMVSEYTKTIDDTTSQLLEFSNSYLESSFTSSEDADVIDGKIENSLSHLSRISGILNIDNSKYPKMDNSESAYGVVPSTGRFKVPEGKSGGQALVYDTRVAYPVKSIHRPTSDTKNNKVHYRNLFISKYSLPMKEDGYYALIKNGYNDKKIIKTAISGLLTTPVAEMKELDKVLDKLNTTSISSGKLIKEIIKKIEKQVEKDSKVYKTKILPKNGIVRYNYLLSIVKMLSYWYLSKSATVRVIENKSKGFDEVWIK